MKRQEGDYIPIIDNSNLQYKMGFRLITSLACNNRCDYCHVYLNNKKKLQTNELMSFETAKTVFDHYYKLIKEPLKTSVSISLYGGESLLNWKMLNKIIPYGNNLYKNVKQNLWILNTNGRLITDKKAIFLKENKVDIHISVDGPDEQANTYRKSITGKSTFKDIVRALKVLKKCNHNLQFDTCITDKNMHKLIELIDLAAEYGASRIYLALTDFSNWQNKYNINTDIVANYLINAVSYGNKLGIRIGGPWYESIFASYENKEKEQFLFPYLFVKPSGNLFIEPFPSNILGKIDNLNSLTSSLKYKEVLELWKKEKESCNNCVIQKSCSSFLKQLHMYHTDKNHGYNNECELAKDILDKIPLIFGGKYKLSQGQKLKKSKHIELRDNNSNVIVKSTIFKSKELKIPHKIINQISTFKNSNSVSNFKENLQLSDISTLLKEKILLPQEVSENAQFLINKFNLNLKYKFYTDNFKCFCSESNKNTALFILPIAEEVFDLLSNKFGTKIKEKITIILCSSNEELKRLWKESDLPKWVTGFVVLNKVLVFGPDLRFKNKKEKESLTANLKHELCHILLAEIKESFNKDFPLWFEEGLCEYFSRQYKIDIINIFLKRKKPFSFRDLEVLADRNFFKLDNSPINNNLCYLQSYSFINFLIELKGIKAFNNCFFTSSETDFYKNIIKIYKYSILQLEDKWLKKINVIFDDKFKYSNLTKKLIPSKNLKVISSKSKFLLYNSFTGGNIICNKDLKEIVKFLINGKTIREIEEIYEIPDLNNLILNLYDKQIIEYNDKYHNNDLYIPPVMYENKIKNGYLISDLRLNVSTNCNLNCAYCYVDRKKPKNEALMTWETAKKSINEFIELLKKNNKTNAKIRFFGGEPLLNWEVLKKSIEYTEKIKEQINVFYIINTNGTIFSKEIAETVSKYNVSLTISLDGIENIHNTSRPFMNKKGSFSKIDKNLELFIKNECNVNIDCVLGDHNYGYLKDFSNYILKKNKKLGYTLIVGFQNICMGYQNFKPKYSVKQKVEYILDTISHSKENGIVGNKYINNYTGMIFYAISKLNKSKKHGLGKYCVAAGQELSVFPNGEIKPCSSIKTILGHISNLNKVFTNPHYLELTKRVAGNIPDCRGCEIEAFCAGGCIGDAADSKGNIFKPTKNCDFEKTFFKEAVKQLFLSNK